MNLVELDELSYPKSYYDFYNKKYDKIYLNKNCLIPSHINPNVKFTEIYLKKDSDKLFVNIGESWAYGEGLPGIRTVLSEFNLQTMIQYTFGNKIANVLGSDLYQYAVPGNNNLYMHIELDRILNYVSTLGYKKIYVAINHTENTRESNITGSVYFMNHAINNLYRKSKLNIKDWVKAYDEVWLDHIEKLKELYPDIEFLAWRNFTRKNTEKNYPSLKLPELTWAEYSARLESIDLKSPAISNFPCMHDLANDIRFNIEMDRDWFEDEMTLQEKVAEFIRESTYHKNHPNEIGHLAWALYLVKQAGWANI
jgi:hypothetical protein